VKIRPCCSIRVASGYRPALSHRLHDTASTSVGGHFGEGETTH
jgi:hypothetical protein